MTILECTNDRIQQQDLELAAAGSLPWEKLDGAGVLITGATGLVGSQLVKTLLAANRIHGIRCRVIAMVRSREKAERVFGHLLERDALELYFGDVT